MTAFVVSTVKDKNMRKFIIFWVTITTTSIASAGEYIGRLGGNMFCGDCSANEFSLMNNQFYPYGLKNSFGPYGNEFSPYSGKNQFSTMGPALYGEDLSGEDDETTPADEWPQ